MKSNCPATCLPRSQLHPAGATKVARLFSPPVDDPPTYKSTPSRHSTQNRGRSEKEGKTGEEGKQGKQEQPDPPGLWETPTPLPLRREPLELHELSGNSISVVDCWQRSLLSQRTSLSFLPHPAAIPNTYLSRDAFTYALCFATTAITSGRLLLPRANCSVILPYL